MLRFVRITHLISFDLISSELTSTECAAKRPSLPWLRPTRTKKVAQFALRSVEPGCFSAAHSPPLISDETRSVEMRSDEIGWVIGTLINDLLFLPISTIESRVS